jgi:hypothetical protein
MVAVEQVDDILAVNNNLQHLLEQTTSRIHCLNVASLLRICCCKDVIEAQIKTMRAALLEVARWEHVIQWYPRLFICGCIVINHASKLSGFILWTM